MVDGGQGFSDHEGWYSGSYRSHLPLILQKISTMVPTEEEKQKIQEAQLANPDVPLGSAEQFLLALSSITELSARLQLWAFKLDYETAEQVRRRGGKSTLRPLWLPQSRLAFDLVSAMERWERFWNGLHTFPRGSSNA